MRFFGGFLVYLLVGFGAVVMLLPFGWMVSTSFKLPSEVNRWPPQWGSENFLNKREIKIKVGTERVGTSWEGIGIREALSMVSLEEEENVLRILVNDDPFYRGELHILVESEGDYARRVPMKAVEDLIESHPKILKKSDFESADEFFRDFFLEYAELLNRVKFTGDLEGVISSSEKVGKTVLRFLKRRVKDEEERKSLEEFILKSLERLDRARSDLTVYKRGESKILTLDEVRSLHGVLKSLVSEITPPALNDPGAKALLKLFNLKVVVPLREELEVLEFYLETLKRFEEVQKERLDGKEIVARFRKKSERISLLIERLRSDERLKGYSKVIDSLIEEGIENLPERFISALDRDLSEDLERLGLEKSRTLTVVSELRQVVSSLIAISTEKGVNVFEISKRSKSMEEFLRDLESGLGDLASFKVARGKLRKIEGMVEGSVFGVLRKVVDEALAISRLRKLYNDTLSELEIDKAPSIVESVRVRDGKMIEIVLKGVSPVYLEDERYRVAVFFSPLEVLANVFQNYVDAWHSAPFGRYYLNTVLVATTTTLLEVVVASMAAFAFSVLRFPGRDFLFGLFLMTMMVPGEVLLVPNFITVSKFGWIDTYYALIVPWIVSVFAIFLIRQHFLTLPSELYDAAKIDGCSSWRYLWTIAVPLSKPVIITGALLKFVGSWNAFLWVLIVTNSEKYRTLPVGLHTFSSEAGTIYNQLMAAATFSILPVIVLFLFMQKYFIRGIARTGLK